MCKSARVIECTTRIPAIMIWLAACLPSWLSTRLAPGHRMLAVWLPGWLASESDSKEWFRLAVILIPTPQSAFADRVRGVSF